MMNRTPLESEAANIAKMGDGLGRQYSLLWQEMAFLYREWLEYVELFGTSEKRVEALNRAAPTFFSLIQGTLWKDVLLRICRLTDPETTGRKSDRSNLTIQNLPALVEVNLQAALKTLIDQALQSSQFCRDWRNRHIAHHDLALALGTAPAPLETATRLKVKEALDAIVMVLNAVAGHYLDSETKFDFSATIGGATSLVYVIDDGLKRQEDRKKRLLRGESLLPEDSPHQI